MSPENSGHILQANVYVRSFSYRVQRDYWPIHQEWIVRQLYRLREAGLTFRSDIIRGVGGAQAVLEDSSGNPVELFQPR